MTTVLITGANKGLGRETARQLAEQGWTVLLGARDEQRGKQAAADLAASGADVRYISLDVTSDESVDAAVRLVESFGCGLDVLVNNAGVAMGGPSTLSGGDPADTVPADFLACYGVNVLGPVRVTRAFLPLLRRSAQPKIVMVSSGMGSFAVTTDPSRLEHGIIGLVYPSSKAALNMVTTMYAKALPGFQVNAVDPGYTATDLNGHRGVKPVEQGARPIVERVLAGPDEPTGGFFDETGRIGW